ncbi:N-acetyl-D-Glu racemase DgcA [Telmatospirillum siberiense]|uniref:Dipeptide epimerase n=1 Tax=Telmatospirillum siberiense TaxID=382514 RepID=A0A2N3PPN1_9PROT|nr:N-acetyl-D-Glu racemase DgcA [Telmatospirillum siberiense]PKU22344.1 dipeptide epimerase [Telmatospirillum siberiense]
MPTPILSVVTEHWPIAGGFTISRGSRTEAVVVVATLDDGTVRGHGECVPYARYGETVEGVAAAIEAMAPLIAGGLTRRDLAARMPAGAARNALDAAFWDFEAKASGHRVWNLAGIAAPKPVTTAFTLSLGSPDSMAAAAEKAAGRPLLKIKLGGAGDDRRIAAVRAAAPAATLIADANEAWTPEVFAVNLAACEKAGVALIEQPLPAGQDAFLETVKSPIAFCADESFHGRDGLAAMRNRYQAVNIKLDKTGGLTEALAVANAVREAGLDIMVGCMLGTSLAMAPAFLLTPQARFVDLDGPLLLSRDRDPGIAYEGSTMQPFGSRIWG